MSDIDPTFPPSAPKLPRPAPGEAAVDYMERVVAQLNDYEDIDITFPGATSPETLAVIHGLRRVPSSFELLFVDEDTNVSAAMTTGWGYNVVYLQATAACHVRIRLR